MNEVTLSHVLLTNGLRQQIQATLEGRERVLATGAEGAASGSMDAEAIHDFRVSLRRMRTFMRVARIVWSSKQLSRIENELRYFAQVTGTQRDHEVLRDTLLELALPQAAHDELGAWLVRRSRDVRSERRNVMRILRDGPSLRDAPVPLDKKPIRPLDRVLAKLDDLLGAEPMHVLTAAELGKLAIERALRDVVRGAQADVHDIEAMHALRIREKRLRYTAELFVADLGEEAARLVKHATRMQRRLGELHDVDQALAAVTHARGLAPTTQQATGAALHAARQACAAKLEPLLVETRSLGDQTDASR